MPTENTGIRDALALKAELLKTLRREEALTSDALKKFELQKRITDLETEITTLKAKLVPESHSESVDYTIHVHSPEGHFTKHISGGNSANPLEQHLYIGTNKKEKLTSPKKSIKSMIINGNLEQAIESFLKMTEDTDEDLYDEITLIAARFNATHRNYKHGVITLDQCQLVEAQTSKALLSLLKSLK